MAAPPCYSTLVLPVMQNQSLLTRMLVQIGTPAKDGDRVAYATALLHAPAYSGQERYRTTMKAVADGNGHRKLRKQAAVAMKQLDNYKSWTPIVGNPTDYRRDKSPDVDRLAKHAAWLSGVAAIDGGAAHGSG
jgi:hypothetical protein